MGDSAGIRGGLRNQQISRQPEPIPLYPFAAPAGHSMGSEVTSLLASSSASGPVPPLQPLPQPGSKAPQRIPRWLERGELILRVLLRIYIGVAICYAPWSHIFWDRNPLFTQFPTLADFATSGAVRGIVSGLGLLNLWIAFQEAIRHGDHKR